MFATKKITPRKMGLLQVFQSKSMFMFPTFTKKTSVIIVVISLLSLFPSALGAMAMTVASSPFQDDLRNASDSVDHLKLLGSLTQSISNSSHNSEGRSPRSTGWLWNHENSNGNTNSPPSKDENFGPGKRESSSRVVVGKQVHQDSDVEIVEGRGYFTFLDFSTSPVPPVTIPTTRITTQNNTCICVPYYRCDEGQVVTDGSGVIDIRHGWACNSVLEVCCRNPRPTIATTSSPISTPSPTSSPVTAIPGFTPQCGTLNPNGINARILGFTDSETQFGEYPWMGAVLESKFVRGKWVLQFLCGASLITPKVIVTAAHCVKGKKINHLVIRLGEWDTQSTNEFYPYQDIKVWEVVVHPQYYGGGLYNDIAILFLKTSAVLSPHIDTICLPEVTPQYDPTACWATGWGKSAFGPSGQYQAILREVELGVTPRDACQAALRRTNLGPKFTLHNSFLCAGGLKGLDTCIGDGGGPLVCASLTDPWRYVLVGIVSWGVNCGTYGVPGVYIDVPKFRTWIDNNIRARYPFYNANRWTISGSTLKTLPQQDG